MLWNFKTKTYLRQKALAEISTINKANDEMKVAVTRPFIADPCPTRQVERRRRMVVNGDR